MGDGGAPALGSSNAVAGRAKQRVLVTGGAGFLGAAVARTYLARGASVRIVGRTAASVWVAHESRAAGVELVDMDLRDVSRNEDVFAELDLVIHTAAMLHAETPSERVLQEQVNVGVTRAVTEACRRNGVFRLVHVSSTAALGIPESSRLPANEEFRFNLGHLDLGYAETKRRAEEVVLDANGSSALETVIVNPGFIFGRHRSGYRGREVVERVLRSRVVPCTNGGLSIVHVDDVAGGIWRAAADGRAGERYILSGENLSFREIAHTVCELSGERRLVLPVPDPVRDAACFFLNSMRTGTAEHPACRLRRFTYAYYSSEKARRELGYRPRPFAQIVADMLDYLRGGENTAPSSVTAPSSPRSDEAVDL